MFPSKGEGSGSSVLISKYLSPKLVCFLKETKRDAVLKELVNLCDQQNKLLDADAFYKAILEREQLVSTGIGMGMAIPHAKLAGYKTFFIAIGVHPQGVAWEAIDGVPVRVVFMIGGPDNKQTEYLQILSRLTLALKDKERRKKMLQLSSEEAMIDLFKGI